MCSTSDLLSLRPLATLTVAIRKNENIKINRNFL